jgi:hypothetical protein
MIQIFMDDNFKMTPATKQSKDFVLIYKTEWGKYALYRPTRYTLKEAKNLAKNGVLAIHHVFLDCLGLM